MIRNPQSPTAPMRVVYDPDGNGVKPRQKKLLRGCRLFICHTSIFSVISLPLLSIGCTSPRALREKIQPLQTFPVIAVRYHVPLFYVAHERKHDSGGESDLHDIRDDFNVIKNLGFHTVLIHHTANEKHSPIEKIARQTGLNLDFVSRRVVDQPANNFNQSNQKDYGKVTDHANWLGSSTHTSEPVLRQSIGQTTNFTVKNHGSLAFIDMQKRDSDLHYSTSTQILSQYHRSLMAGNVDGIVVENVPGLHSSPGFDEPLQASDRTAISGLISRAKIWGDALYGLYARPLQPTQPREDVDVTVFFRGRRQYLCIFNRQTSRYARGRVVFDMNDFVYPPERAVEIPATHEKLLGRVVHSREGTLSFSIELRPGDAVLYELF